MVSNFVEVDYVTTHNLHCVCTRVLCKLLAAFWRISILTQFTQLRILENIGIDLVAAVPLKLCIARLQFLLNEGDIGMTNCEKQVEQEAAYLIPISLYNYYRTVRHEKRYQE